MALDHSGRRPGLNITRHTLGPSVRQSRATYLKSMALDNQLTHSHTMQLSYPFHKSVSARELARNRSKLR